MTSLTKINGLFVGITLFFSSCHGDAGEDDPPPDISLIGGFYKSPGLENISIEGKEISYGGRLDFTVHRYGNTDRTRDYVLSVRPRLYLQEVGGEYAFLPWPGHPEGAAIFLRVTPSQQGRSFRLNSLNGEKFFQRAPASACG